MNAETSATPDRYDAIIAGGGPAGATTALLMARAGLRVCLLEKEQHPRFHIGESILPRTMPLLRELGLEDAMRRLPHVPKYGAEFAFGDSERSLMFNFCDGLFPGDVVFNIERSIYDQFLLSAAREAGAEVCERTTVKAIKRLEHDAVSVAVSGGGVDRTIDARLLMDCSGHGTIVGRHLGTRKNFDDPNLQKVAYFEHFDHVERPPGEATGHPCIIMCEEGWFWLIGLNATRTSVGFVTRPNFVKTLDVPPDRLLAWAVARCPAVRHRMRNAVGQATNRVLADFSYRCRPYAGPGYFLVGDAGCFLDPIFSTGATLAMMGAQAAAGQAVAMLRGQTTPQEALHTYVKFVDDSTGIFWRMIRGYYHHSFRELFMQGTGPLQVHNAIISILAGQVFPRPVWALRWRMWMFHAMVRAQKILPLVPRRKPFSLLATLPVEVDFSPSDLRSTTVTYHLEPSLTAAGT